MNEDIRNAIERSLPAEVGKVLQARLALCDRLETEHRDDQERIRALEKRLATQNDLERRMDEVHKREETLVKVEREMEINKARLEVERQMTSQLLLNNMEIVRAVFANSRFKYQERETVPVVVPCSGGGGFVQSSERQKSIETEGEPPRT